MCQRKSIVINNISTYQHISSEWRTPCMALQHQRLFLVALAQSVLEANSRGFLTLRSAGAIIPCLHEASVAASADFQCCCRLRKPLPKRRKFCGTIHEQVITQMRHCAFLQGCNRTQQSRKSGRRIEFALASSTQAIEVCSSQILTKFNLCYVPPRNIYHVPACKLLS